jgi:hypothetical protein
MAGAAQQADEPDDLADAFIAMYLERTEMYCPKCSALLEEDPRGWLRCSSGQLEFSIDLSRRLRDRYGTLSTAVARTPDFSGRDFFCPGCATAISKGDEVCPKCGVSLRPLVWPLVELHPHGDGAGKYF